MTRQEFSDRITDIVNNYITYYIAGRGDDPQVRVNPQSLYTDLVADRDHMLDIGYSDEALEEAAAADTESYAEAMDSQARQNPDYYAVKSLITLGKDGKPVADTGAIEAIADTYFRR